MVVALALAVLAAACGSDSPTTAASSAPPTTAHVTTTTTAATTSTAPAVPATPHVWPLAGAAPLPTPEDAARTFAVDYLGMKEARVGATSADGVEVFPNANATARTLVAVSSSGGGYVVTGARADEIVVDTPTAGSPIQRPTTTVAGSSTAFEAQLALQYRAVGSTDVLTRSTAMGGSNGEIGPFHTTIPTPDGSPLVLVVAESDASGRGEFTKATVILLGT